MEHVLDLFSLKRAQDQDDRVRRNLLPQKVVLTRGNVVNSHFLLDDNPVQAALERGNICVLENRDGEKAAILLDFGRELHGNLSLTSAYIRSENHRVRVTIRFGESVMEALTPLGEKNTTNDHAVRDHVYDIGQLSTTQTNDSGFRFALIQLEDSHAILELQGIHMGFLFRDIPYLGTFRCSDKLLEDIFLTAAYTVHLNMQNYLWDGIKRDRLAWQGDMHTEVLTIAHVFGANGVVPKTLDFLKSRTEPGHWINGYSSYSLWWIMVQADWYRYTGDFGYLASQKEFLLEQTRMALGCVAENGEERLTEHRFLDWPNLANREATHAGLQGLMRLALLDAAWLLDILGERKQADCCAAMAERMKAHVPDCRKSKQAGAFQALAGLEDAGKIHKEVLAPGGASGYSTFLGYYILAAKAMAGDYAGALDDLRQYWGGMLKMGATSFWEDFDIAWMDNAGRIDEVVPEGKKDIHGDFGSHCYQNFRHSLCHGWSSGPVPFLMRHILGITILEPGCKKLRVAPHLDTLTYAEGSFPTPQGIVHVSHKVCPDGRVNTVYEAPEGIDIILG